MRPQAAHPDCDVWFAREHGEASEHPALPSTCGIALLTIPQAAAVLNVAENWLRKKVTAAQVPHTRLGRHVRFTEEHLRQIVAAGEQAVPPSPPRGRRGLSPRARKIA
ncbi:MAG: helix-turn-helix domain-containing protein [Mycobacteriales bacterium]